MDWVSFTSGFIVTAFAFALFIDNNEDEEELEVELATNEEDDVLVNDFKTRHVILSCQTCRKQKKHKEISPDLYQCTRCKRHIDMRRAS